MCDTKLCPHFSHELEAEISRHREAFKKLARMEELRVKWETRNVKPDMKWAQTLLGTFQEEPEEAPKPKPKRQKRAPKLKAPELYSLDVAWLWDQNQPAPEKQPNDLDRLMKELEALAEKLK